MSTAKVDGALVYALLDAMGLPRTSAQRIIIDPCTIYVAGLRHNEDGRPYIDLETGDVARYAVEHNIDWPKP